MKDKFGTISLAITIASFFAWPMGNAFADTFVVKGVKCKTLTSDPQSISDVLAHVNATSSARVMTVQIKKDGCKPKGQYEGLFQVKLRYPGGFECSDFCPDTFAMERSGKTTNSMTLEIPADGGWAYIRFVAGELASGTFDYEYTIH